MLTCNDCGAPCTRPVCADCLADSPLCRAGFDPPPSILADHPADPAEYMPAGTVTTPPPRSPVDGGNDPQPQGSDRSAQAAARRRADRQQRLDALAAECDAVDSFAALDDAVREAGRLAARMAAAGRVCRAGVPRTIYPGLPAYRGIGNCCGPHGVQGGRA